MRRWHWLGLAAVLLLAAVWLMHGTNPREVTTPQIESPRFPTYPTVEERERRVTRQRLIVPPQPPSLEAPKGTQEIRLDPMFVALGQPHGAVLEASAVLHSEVGQALFECLSGEEDFHESLDAFERRVGFRLNDLDRIGFDGDVVVISAARQAPPEISGQWQTLSDQSRLSVEDNKTIGLFGDDLMILGETDAVERALRRLENKERPVASLPEEIAYGEVYGRAEGRLLEALLGGGNEEMAPIREAIRSVEFHFDVQHDVAMYYEVRGDDAKKLDDVAKTVAGALSAARMQATMTGDDELSQLLEFTRVGARSAGFFTLEVVLPKDFVLERFAECSPDGRRAYPLRPDDQSGLRGVDGGVSPRAE